MNTFVNVIGNKYLTLIHTNKGKDALKKYGELYNKIKNYIIKLKILLDQQVVTQVIMIKNK